MRTFNIFIIILILGLSTTMITETQAIQYYMLEVNIEPEYKTYTDENDGEYIVYVNPGIIDTTPDTTIHNERGHNMYETGTVVTIRAIASDNWVFHSWTINNETLIENPTKVTMNANITVIVTFFEPEIIVSFTEQGSGLNRAIFGSSEVAQTFTPNRNFMLTHAKMMLSDSGVDGSKVTVAIRMVENGTISDFDLTSGNINRVINEMGWYMVEFDPQIILPNGEYALICRAPNVTIKTYAMFTPADRYPDGEFLTSSDGGNTWRAENKDLPFAILGSKDVDTVMKFAIPEFPLETIAILLVIPFLTLKWRK